MSLRNGAKKSRRWSRNTDWERPALGCGAMPWPALPCRPAASRSPRASAICPTSSPRSNGGARPYLAEIALVGKGPGRYNLYLGAAFDGSRMAKLYAENLDHDSII